jgi:hypothetical protein
MVPWRHLQTLERVAGGFWPIDMHYTYDQHFYWTRLANYDTEGPDEQL